MAYMILDPASQPVDYTAFTLEDLGRTHFVGIGGAGMSVLAEMLLENGVDVSGSDREANTKTERLKTLGARIYIGQSAGNVHDADTVVWSSAIKPDNPEIIAARGRGALLLHRSDILALLMQKHQYAVTVAGAHGKTTTSAMLAQILAAQGEGDLKDPSFAVGGSIRTPRGSIDGGHAGTGKAFVAEADESDGSFKKYHPYIAVITNVEPDHLDHYGSADAFMAAFAEHAHHAQKYVVLCGDDEGALSVLASMGEEASRHCVVYTARQGIDLKGSYALRVLITNENETAEKGGTGNDRTGSKALSAAAERFSLTFPSSLIPEMYRNKDGGGDTQTFDVKLRVPGIHNARNAAAAIISAVLMGMDPQKACGSAFEFYGAKRRFEVRGTEGGVTVIDDYAHHPTEIEALLHAAKRRFPQSAIHVIFQPHLFSRTHFFAQQFADALNIADDVVVTDIFPAREKQEDWPGISPDTVVSRIGRQGPHTDAHSIPDMDTAARFAADRARPGDIIITVGAGSITDAANTVLEQLRHNVRRAQNGKQGSHV